MLRLSLRLVATEDDLDLNLNARTSQLVKIGHRDGARLGAAGAAAAVTGPAAAAVSCSHSDDHHVIAGGRCCHLVVGPASECTGCSAVASAIHDLIARVAADSPAFKPEFKLDFSRLGTESCNMMWRTQPRRRLIRRASESEAPKSPTSSFRAAAAQAQPAWKLGPAWARKPQPAVTCNCH